MDRSALQRVPESFPAGLQRSRGRRGEDLGLRVEGLGFKIRGLGFEVWVVVRISIRFRAGVWATVATMGWYSAQTPNLKP